MASGTAIPIGNLPVICWYISQPFAYTRRNLSLGHPGFCRGLWPNLFFGISSHSFFPFQLHECSLSASILSLFFLSFFSLFPSEGRFICFLSPAFLFYCSNTQQGTDNNREHISALHLSNSRGQEKAFPVCSPGKVSPSVMAVALCMQCALPQQKGTGAGYAWWQMAAPVLKPLHMEHSSVTLSQMAPFQREGPKVIFPSIVFPN